MAAIHWVDYEILGRFFSFNANTIDLPIANFGHSNTQGEKKAIIFSCAHPIMMILKFQYNTFLYRQTNEKTIDLSINICHSFCDYMSYIFKFFSIFFALIYNVK